jgi:hypothetical protein
MKATKLVNTTLFGNLYEMLGAYVDNTVFDYAPSKPSEGRGPNKGGVETSSSNLQFTLGFPSFTRVNNLHRPLHDGMNGVTQHRAFCHAIGNHVSCVQPDKGRQSLAVKQFSNMQHMTQQRLV